MKKSKIILSYLFGFLTSVSISLFVLLLIIKFTVYDKSYITNLLIKNDYYTKVSTEIKEEMEGNTLSTGFTDVILENLFTEEEVVDDINTFINNTYDGKKTELNKDNIKTNLENNINAFLKKSNLKILNQDDVNKFANDLVDIYKNEICLYGFLDNYISTFAKIGRIINTLLIIFSIAIFILLILLKVVNSHYISSSLIASGLIILFVRIFVYEKIDINGLLIITELFSNILRLILTILGKMLLSIGIGLIIVGVILLCQMIVIDKIKACKLLKRKS